MEKISIKLLVILAIWSTILIAQDNCISKLMINSTDSSAVIYIDGKMIGYGTVKADVSKGKHIIYSKSDIRKWNAHEVYDSVLIEDCGIEKHINLSFSKPVYLSSDPINAQVYYKDSLIGTTPLYLSSEISQVDLKKKDYRTEKVGLENLSPNNSTIKLDFIGKGNRNNFFRTNMFKILLGSAVVLGGAAAYYKLKANDFFDDYNRTGKPSALDNTNKYDKISGIAFGALQVNFGVILYYLLTEE